MSKAARDKAITALKTSSSTLKLRQDAGDLTSRLLKKLVELLQKRLAEAEDAHNDFLCDEKNSPNEKEDATKEWETVFLEIIDILDKGEEALEALGAASSVVTISNAEKQAMGLERETACMNRFKVRAKNLSSSLNALANPNKGQLEVHNDMLKTLRKETMDLLTTAFSPIIEDATTATKLKAIEKAKENKQKEVDETLDEIQARIISLIPVSPQALSSSSVNVSTASNSSSVAPFFKGYKNLEIPTFKGDLKEFPKWKKEMEKLVLPQYPEPLLQIRILDSHSPKSCDLQNCVTVEEAWIELMQSFGNPVNITAKLTDEFLAFKPKGKSDETKFVEIKKAVVSLSSDLVAVGHKLVFTVTLGFSVRLSECFQGLLLINSLKGNRN